MLEIWDSPFTNPIFRSEKLAGQEILDAECDLPQPGRSCSGCSKIVACRRNSRNPSPITSEGQFVDSPGAPTRIGKPLPCPFFSFEKPIFDHGLGEINVFQGWIAGDGLSRVGFGSPRVDSGREAPLAFRTGLQTLDSKALSSVARSSINW